MPMTKGEIRAARRAARAEGRPLEGSLALPAIHTEACASRKIYWNTDDHHPCDCQRDDADDSVIFTDSARGRAARDRWARRYDSLNGAPEDDNDR